MKQLLIASMVLSLSGFAFAEHHGQGHKESQAPEAQAVNQACAKEAEEAKCGADKVGTGLMKCLHHHKKANKKTFTIGDGCKDAMKNWREVKHEKHEKHESKKVEETK